jgi:hypothetical protein
VGECLWAVVIIAVIEENKLRLVEQFAFRAARRSLNCRQAW